MNGIQVREGKKGKERVECGAPTGRCGQFPVQASGRPFQIERAKQTKLEKAMPFEESKKQLVFVQRTRVCAFCWCSHKNEKAKTKTKKRTEASDW